MFFFTYNVLEISMLFSWTVYHRLTSCPRLGKDAVCQNFTEVLPRFAMAYNTVVNAAELNRVTHKEHRRPEGRPHTHIEKRRKPMS